jgi:hypothetical protein
MLCRLAPPVAAPCRPKRLLVFINPYAGPKRAHSTWSTTAGPIMQLAGVACNLVETQGPVRSCPPCCATATRQLPPPCPPAAAFTSWPRPAGVVFSPDGLLRSVDAQGHAQQAVAALDPEQLSSYDGVIAVGGDGLFQVRCRVQGQLPAEGGAGVCVSPPPTLNTAGCRALLQVAPVLPAAGAGIGVCGTAAAGRRGSAGGGSPAAGPHPCWVNGCCCVHVSAAGCAAVARWSYV